MAVRAEEMTHVLAPRPGGVLAALEAAPDADVLMVAHTGLDHLVTVSDLWRELPMDKQITMRWWEVPRSEIPEGREARIEWLFGWWERDRRVDRGEPASEDLVRLATDGRCPEPRSGVGTGSRTARSGGAGATSSAARRRCR